MKKIRMQNVSGVSSATLLGRKPKTGKEIGSRNYEQMNFNNFFFFVFHMLALASELCHIVQEDIGWQT